MSKLQDRLVGEQVRHAVGPFSPYWKRRLTELGTTPSSIASVASLATIPAAGERDISPHGDPAGMAALVVQSTETGFAMHATGPALRRALRLRVTDKAAYRSVIEQDTKPTTYVWTGLGFHYPVASTRADLDIVARTGARLWQVLGLTADDALLAALPAGTTTEHVALSYAAMASGAPALFPGDRIPDLVAAARLAPPTVLAVPVRRAADVISAIVDGGGHSRLRTVLLVGAPADAERAAARDALGSTAADVLAVHAPAGARVLWGECREAGQAGGLHTYPDVEVVQLIDPETGAAADDGGEVVLTQLGMRGSALLRWRTGDVTPGRIDSSPCPGCKRTVPRITGLRRAALVLVSEDGHALDLRSVAGAMAGRADLGEWRVVVGGRRRDGRAQVVVHLAPTGDPGEAVVGAAADIRTLAGVLPTQLVVGEPDEVAGLAGEPLTRRILLRT